MFNKKFGKIMAVILVVCVVTSMFAMPAGAVQKQIYIRNNDSGYLLLTGSLKGNTSSSSCLRTCFGTSRTDLINGGSYEPGEQYCSYSVRIYHSYGLEVSAGTYVGSIASSGYIAPGNYVNTGTLQLGLSANVQKLGSYHTFNIITGESHYSTLGMYLSGGELVEDSSVIRTQ
jgi:hypothetical protein